MKTEIYILIYMITIVPFLFYETYFTLLIIFYLCMVLLHFPLTVYQHKFYWCLLWIITIFHRQLDRGLFVYFTKLYYYYSEGCYNLFIYQLSLGLSVLSGLFIIYQYYTKKRF